eukprot:12778-Heterococcus_DN1.PRE.1
MSIAVASAAAAVVAFTSCELQLAYNCYCQSVADKAAVELVDSIISVRTVLVAIEAEQLYSTVSAISARCRCGMLHCVSVRYIA